MSGKALRLDRLLANLGYGSRREVSHMVRSGWITLDDVVLTDADQKIPLSADLSARMKVRGKRLDPLPPFTLMIHKPVGVVCSHKESHSERIYDLLPGRWLGRDPAMSTVGRLDKETSGLLILTDDGGLLHRIISPKSSIAKRYRVELDRPLKGDEGAIFASGAMMLEGETDPLLPAELTVLGPKEAYLVLTEGRYHQVRRMFAAVGNHVTGLHRDRIGNLTLPASLEPAQFRMLSEAQIARLFEPPAV